jgi:hypothetical protein
MPKGGYVRRASESFSVSEPVIEPILVGSLGSQELGGDNAVPWCMAATIDPNALPGLREAFEHHRPRGTPTDVVS